MYARRNNRENAHRSPNEVVTVDNYSEKEKEAAAINLILNAYEEVFQQWDIVPEWV